MVDYDVRRYVDVGDSSVGGIRSATFNFISGDDDVVLTLDYSSDLPEVALLSYSGEFCHINWTHFIGSVQVEG